MPHETCSFCAVPPYDLLGGRKDLWLNWLSPAILKSSFCGRYSGRWNDATTDERVFYVVITLNGTAVSKFETENLVVAALSTGVTHRIGSDPLFSNTAGNILDSTVTGQYVTYTVPGVASGTYDVRVGVKNAKSRGIFQLGISRSDQLDMPTSVEAYARYDIRHQPNTSADRWQNTVKIAMQ